MVETPVNEKIKIIERIIGFFGSRGFSKISESKLNEEDLQVKPDLAFQKDDMRVFVKFADISIVEDRTKFIKTIMEISTLINYCDKLYLVIPKFLATIIDSDILKEKGIGLITYNGKITEVLPAVSRKVREILVKKENIETMFQEISDLKRLVVELIEEIRELKERITTVERKISELRVVTVTEVGVKEVKETVTYSETQTMPELPSFFQDNPWLEILSKRGKERMRNA